uniref:Uncharacterized protein n=1 Tax=Helianthus annuus TaxID=4232 RepID=A0A251TS76_HELAN
MMVDFARTNGALVQKGIKIGTVHLTSHGSPYAFSLNAHTSDKKGCQKQGSTIYRKKQHFTFV